MKSTIDENLKRIEQLQKEVLLLKPSANYILEIIGSKEDEIQNLQSENSIMLEEMKAGKNIE